MVTRKLTQASGRFDVRVFRSHHVNTADVGQSIMDRYANVAPSIEDAEVERVLSAKGPNALGQISVDRPA
jgi:hypothetical protein